MSNVGSLRDVGSGGKYPGFRKRMYSGIDTNTCTHVYACMSFFYYEHILYVCLYISLNTNTQKDANVRARANLHTNTLTQTHTQPHTQPRTHTHTHTHKLDKRTLGRREHVRKDNAL